MSPYARRWLTISLYNQLGHTVLTGETLSLNRRDKRSILKTLRSANGKRKESMLEHKENLNRSIFLHFSFRANESAVQNRHPRDTFQNRCRSKFIIKSILSYFLTVSLFIIL